MTIGVDERAFPPQDMHSGESYLLEAHVKAGSAIALLESLRRFAEVPSHTPFWVTDSAFHQIAKLCSVGYKPRKVEWKKVFAQLKEAAIYDLVEEVKVRAPEVKQAVLDSEKAHSRNASRNELLKERRSFLEQVGVKRDEKLDFALTLVRKRYPNIDFDQLMGIVRRVRENGREHPKYFFPLKQNVLRALALADVADLHKIWIGSEFRQARLVELPPRSPISTMLSTRLAPPGKHSRRPRSSLIDRNFKLLPPYARSIIVLLDRLRFESFEERAAPKELLRAAFWLMADLYASNLGSSSRFTPILEEGSRIRHVKRYLAVDAICKKQRAFRLKRLKPLGHTDQAFAAFHAELDERRYLGKGLQRAAELARQDLFGTPWGGDTSGIISSFKLVLDNIWLVDAYGDVELNMELDPRQEAIASELIDPESWDELLGFMREA